MIEIEDAVLLWRFKRGSQDALRYIYEKYRCDLVTVAVNLLGDTNSAEDVVQDVFVSFVKSIETFRLTGSLKGYLATCVANRSRDCLRQKKRRRIAMAKEEASTTLSAIDPIQQVAKNDELQCLSSAMSQLPHLQREAIVLHLHGGLKFRQIAKVQDVSIKTTQSRFRCGLEKLRSILNGEV
jgi:RNA polymerase sigma-70 factor (ECF subfamily)